MTDTFSLIASMTTLPAQAGSYAGVVFNDYDLAHEHEQQWKWFHIEGELVFTSGCWNKYAF